MFLFSFYSLGLSDLHGDGRIHPKSGPGRRSGFGFELTFRLARERGESTPPTWPANVMQKLAKYVFNSGNMLLPGDHVSWHAPLDGGDGRITQILMERDSQLPQSVSTPHGEVCRKTRGSFSDYIRIRSIIHSIKRQIFRSRK